VQAGNEVIKIVSGAYSMSVFETNVLLSWPGIRATNWSEHCHLAHSVQRGRCRPGLVSFDAGQDRPRPGCSRNDL
jgi:hypothetical protein